MKNARRKKEPKIKHDSDLKRKIGHRFKRFRHKIKKSQKQLAEELQLNQSTITNIEVGKTFPKTAYLRHFYDKYRLNAHWLINGSGDMLLTDIQVKKTAFRLLSGLDEHYFKQYMELIQLMKVPVIREVMFGKLEEMKKIAKDDIEKWIPVTETL